MNVSSLSPGDFVNWVNTIPGDEGYGFFDANTVDDYYVEYDNIASLMYFGPQDPYLRDKDWYIFILTTKTGEFYHVELYKTQFAVR
jgi:hypothetical protein